MKETAFLIPMSLRTAGARLLREAIFASQEDRNVFAPQKNDRISSHLSFGCDDRIDGRSTIKF
jgi:hypothetical protein